MKTINAAELKKRIDANEQLRLLDVLPEDRFAQKHIPGSLNVPFEQKEQGVSFAQRVQEKLGIASPKAARKEPVVVYCADKSCNLSPQAARQLESAGFPEVIDFEGGLAAWQEAGYALAGA